MKLITIFNNRIGFALIISFAVLLIVVVAVSAFDSSVKIEEKSKKAAAETRGEKELLVEIYPKPIQTMKLLSFRVTLTDYPNPELVVIDLSMPGMVMGINRFNLKKIDSNIYEGKTIIPTCTTNKTLWLVKVIINHVIEKEVQFNVQQ